MGYFEKTRAHVRPLWQFDPEIGPVLHRGQLGAVWAIARHFADRKQSPAAAVLPMGAGKPAVVCMLPFVLPTRRLLVVAPTKASREMSAEDFRSLQPLRDSSALLDDLPGPRLKICQPPITEQQDRETLHDIDVVIAADKLEAIFRRHSRLSGLFELIIIDDAHHLPATKLTQILDCCTEARTVLLSTVPLPRHRDGRAWTTVYNYPLNWTLGTDVRNPITLTDVESLPDTDDDAHDEWLAGHAIDRIRSPEHRTVGSTLLVHSDTRDDAKRLQQVYTQTGVRLEVVTENDGAARVLWARQALDRGEAAGLIVTGRLSEGLDVPRPRVAVSHKIGRALAPLLQFIARPIRPRSDHPPRTELLALSEPLQKALSALTTQDGVWVEQLPDLERVAAAEERRRHAFLSTFTFEPAQTLPIHSLRPEQTVQVYQLPEGATIEYGLTLSKVGDDEVIYRAAGGDESLLVLVTRHAAKPPWLGSPHLNTVDYRLHIVLLDRDGGVIYVHSERDRDAKNLLADLGLGPPRLEEPRWLLKLLCGAEPERYSNVGMRSALPPRTTRPAYQALWGHDTGGAISPSAARSNTAGHLLAHCQDPNGQPTTIGTSVQRTAVWSQRRCHSLLEFKDWCCWLSELARKGAKTVTQVAPGTVLPWTRRLERYPSSPEAVRLAEGLLVGDIVLNTPALESEQAPLGDVQLDATRIDDLHCQLDMLAGGARLWSGTLTVDGFVETIDEDVEVFDAVSQERGLLSRLLEDFPPTLYFPDGTAARGSLLLVPSEDYPDLANEVLHSWDWSEVDITLETQDRSTPNRICVQGHVLGRLAQEQPDAFILCDDAKDELADVITVAEHDDQVTVGLVHCKASKERTPGTRVKDLYELVGQGTRSARWAVQSPQFWAELHSRIQKRRSTRIHHYGTKRLDQRIADWAEHPPPTEFTISLVQPGLAMDEVNTWANGKLLLVDCKTWIQEHHARFLVIGSPSRR